MAKFTEEKMAAISSKLAALRTLLVNAQENDNDKYMALRAELNMEIIQFCVGGKFYEKKDGSNAIKFTAPLPSRQQVAEVARLVDEFVKLESQAYESDDEDDMSCSCLLRNEVADVDKINNKQLREAIFNGTNGELCYYKRYLTGIDVMTLAGIGEKARKDARLKTLIIGGSIVLVTGIAVGTGIYLYNKKKEEDDMECIDIPPEDDADDIDIDDINDDDIPTVDVDDIPSID